MSRSLCIQNTALVLKKLVLPGRDTLTKLRTHDTETMTPEKISEMLHYAPGLIDDWKLSSARGGARVAMMLAMAHYGDFISLKDMVASMPAKDTEGNPISEQGCKEATFGYDSIMANLVTLNKWYKEYPVPSSPQEEGQSSAPPADADEDDAAKNPDAEASEKADVDPPAMLAERKTLYYLGQQVVITLSLNCDVLVMNSAVIEQL